MRAARALRSPLETSGSGRAGGAAARGREGCGWAGARKPELRPDPATAANLGIVPHPLPQLVPMSFSANFQAPGNEPGGVEGSEEQKGLNGRVGGFAGGCAANGLSARERKGPIPPLTGRVESFLLSPLRGSLAFLLGRGGGGGRKLGKGVCTPSPTVSPGSELGNGHLLRARPLSPLRLHRLRGARRGTPTPCAFCASRTFRISERRGGASVAGRSGGRAVTKSRRGGGEAAELALSHPPPRT